MSIQELADALLNEKMGVEDLTQADLRAALPAFNAAYRAGTPLIPDSTYDRLFNRLADIDPADPWLSQVEPEPDALFGGQTIEHASPMLSTEKAYTAEELSRFFSRVAQAAEGLGIDPETLVYRATPKLDGLAGFDNGQTLATRGNGHSGENVTHLFEAGLRAEGGRGLGAGELVVVEDYYQQVLQPAGFKHPRNFMVGFAGADTYKSHHTDAVAAEALHFVPYQALSGWTGSASSFQADAENIVKSLRETSPYRTDGVVLEVIDPAVRAVLGSTHHHHRWMLALKSNDESVEVTVTELTWQTGRTGRVTPVVTYTPVMLSGALCQKATAHTAQRALKQGLGVGARLMITRSGEVIPKIEAVLAPAETPVGIPECPCCGSTLVADGEYLTCQNTNDCSAQTKGALLHFFKTLDLGEGFGPKAIEKLLDAGHDSLTGVLELGEADFLAAGFGPGQSANLAESLQTLRTTPVPDWRFLASFGLRHLGRGDSRHLLDVIPLETLGQITVADIAAVKGFGTVTAAAIQSQLAARWPEIMAVKAKLQVRHEAPVTSAGPLAGKTVVFTGTLSQPRKAFEGLAAAAGAVVQSSVGKTTQYLVCGDGVGANKRSAAEKYGTTLLDEPGFMAMLDS